MKIENQVCTLDQAKRLKKLGVIQGISLTLYEVHFKEPVLLYRIGKSTPDIESKWDAFTVAELGVMMPSGHDTMYCIGDGWRAYDREGNDCPECLFNTEAEARADMLIHLLENKTITADEVNERLLLR